MGNRSGESVSCWMSEGSYVPLEGRHDQACDVCVVGAGVAGLTTAYLLAKEGRAVSVFDAGPVGSGQSSRSTAHLASYSDDGFLKLIERHGEANVKHVVQSHHQSLNDIQSIIQAEEIDCDFERVDAYMFLGPDDTVDSLQAEWEACQKVGFCHVELLPTVPGLPFDAGPCLKFSDQAKFHPTKYLNGLARAFERLGGRIYLGIQVDRIEDGLPVHMHLGDGSTLSAKQVVVATNSPVNTRFSIHTKQSAVRTYVVGARIPKGSVGPSLYWDSSDPYHYVRVTPDPESAIHDLLIVGGEDHKTGQDHDPAQRFANLETWARDRFPMILGFSYQWSGQVWEPFDCLPFIGRSPGDRHVYIVTGDSGQGFTYAMVAGRLLTDLLQGRETPWQKIYEPSRRNLRSGMEYVRENLNVAWQYADHLRASEVPDLSQIKPGEGAVLHHGLHKEAVYKSESGEVTRCSAVCPHLGGVVHWNSVEKSWDCPCHGSRFAVDGSVITGPALSGLHKIEEPNVSDEAPEWEDDSKEPRRERGVSHGESLLHRHRGLGDS